MIKPAWLWLFCGAVVLLCATPPVHAQSARDSLRDTTRYVLPRIEVNAARERAAPPPVAVSIIRPELLVRVPSANSFDLIRRVAALEVHEQGQGPGFAGDVVIRGFTSDHSADVLLVIDGVPINLPIHGHGEGYADWSVLLPAAISSSRVVYGTASPLYGDFALGGVVEVFTAAAAENTSYSLSGSQHGDAAAWLRTGSSGDDGGRLVAFDLRRQQGWRANSDYLLGNGLLRGWHKLGNARVEGGLAGYATRWNSPGFISVSQYNARDLQAFADTSDGGAAVRLIAHGRLAATLGSNASLQVSSWLLWSDWRLFLHLPEAADAPVQQVGERDRRSGAGAQVEYTRLLGRGEFTLGMSARGDGARYHNGHTEARAQVSERESLSARYHQLALYARGRRQFGRRVGIDVGARADFIRHAALDHLLSSNAWQSASATVLSPKLGARFEVNPALALRGSFSRGFRSAVGVIGDPGRPPILVWASDLGVEYTTQRSDLQAALFRMDVHNERRMDPVTQSISSAGSSVRQGVDARVVWRPVDRLALRVSLTWNDARLTGAYADAHSDHSQSRIVPAHAVQHSNHVALLHPSADVGDVPGVARYYGSSGADLRIGRALLTADARVTGPYIPIGEPTVKTQPYVLFDIGLNLAISPIADLDLSLQNALDIRHPEMRASGYINPGIPRTLRAALRINHKKAAS